MYDDIFASLVIEAANWHTNHAKDGSKFRKGKGEGLKIPYIIHPLQVVYRVQRWGIVEPNEANFDFWKAVLFHDILEDTDMPYDELVRLIGENAAVIVQHLTFSGGSKADYIQSFANKPIEAVVAKIADRCCNVDDFGWQAPDYANKYLYMALDLFRLMDSRKQEIMDRFGDAVWWTITADYVVALTRDDYVVVTTPSLSPLEAWNDRLETAKRLVKENVIKESDIEAFVGPKPN
jgi:hypothetical protein